MLRPRHQFPLGSPTFPLFQLYFITTAPDLNGSDGRDGQCCGWQERGTQTKRNCTKTANCTHTLQFCAGPTLTD